MSSMIQAINLQLSMPIESRNTTITTVDTFRNKVGFFAGLGKIFSVAATVSFVALAIIQFLSLNSVASFFLGGLFILLSLISRDSYVMFDNVHKVMEVGNQELPPKRLLHNRERIAFLLRNTYLIQPTVLMFM
jgi:hypothetical protein